MKICTNDFAFRGYACNVCARCAGPSLPTGGAGMAEMCNVSCEIVSYADGVLVKRIGVLYRAC